MSKWINTTLDNICRPEKGSVISGPFGSNISSKFFVDKGVPVIRGNNMSLSLDKFYDDGFVYITEEKAEELNCYAEEGDLIFTAAGTIGQVGILEAPLKYKKYVISNKQLRVRIDNKKVDILYAYYWFSGSWMQEYFVRNNKGSTVPLITLSELKDAPISYPADITEQKKIVGVIESLSHKINLNQNICAELEAMAKTLYDYWFVQFDFPDENGRPYCTSGGEMVWNAQLKREIPKGWKAGTVGQLGDVVSGGTPTTTHEDYYCNQGIAWITPNDLSGNENKMFISHGERDITQSGLDNSSAVLMPKHSVLLSTRAPIGYLAISNNEICTNQGFKSIVPNAGYHEYFIYYLLKRNVSAIAQQGVGTTFKEVSKDTLSNFAVPLPSKILANNFAEKVTPLCEKRCVLEEENRELERLRDWLLPMLMNGQARVE